MKKLIIDYWSDTCDRKEMAEAVAQGVREVYANEEVEPSSAELTTKKIRNKPFALIGSNDFWRDGQWLKYWEERMKAYGAVVQPDEQITNHSVSALLNSDVRGN